MHIDLYTKTILTLIALLLAVMALKPFVQPTGVKAQSSLNGIEFSFGGTGLWFFDTKSGDIWGYSAQNPNEVEKVGKMTQLGKPLTK